MPTIDARVAASTDDANELSSGNVQTNTTSFNVDQTGEWGAFRVSVTIPDGATIDVAYLTLQFDSSTLDEPDLTIYAEDTATPAAYAAGTATFSISGRTRTTASVNWGSTDLGAPGAFNSPSIVSIIEELMASYSYASGAYMAFMWTSRANDSTRDAQVVFYDGNTSQAPLLHIEYTEAGGGISGTASITLADATVAATGTLPIVGTASPTLAGATLVATGTLAIEGEAAVTLGDVAVVATGVVALEGEAAITLSDVTVAATGALALAGQASVTLADATAAATGTLAIAGALAATLDDVTVAATGDLDNGNSGVAAITLGDVAVVATGALSIAAQAAIALSDVTLSSIGTVVIIGAATMTLADVTMAASGAAASDIPTIAAIIYGPNALGNVYGPATTGEVFGPNPIATLGG